MPSVGMRRTTRVFGVVKGVDGARVLRSGRLLWPGYDEGKMKVESGDEMLKRDVEEWFCPIEIESNGGKEDVWTNYPKSDHDLMSEFDSELEVPSLLITEAVAADNSLDRMWGLVYSRRKRSIARNSEISKSAKNKIGSQDRMFGIRFTRRQRKRKKKSISENSVCFAREAVSPGDSCRNVLTVVLESSSSGRNGTFACFLYSVLRYMRKASMRLSQLSELLSTEPIGSVYESAGIRFFWDTPTSLGSGTCMIFGVNQGLPMFFVNFSAIPQCFMYIYSSMLLRRCWPNALVYNWKAEDTMIDGKFQQMSNPSEITYSECNTTEVAVDNPVNKLVLHPSVRASKLAGRTSQYKNCLNYRNIQKRRSSIKTRRARNLSVIVHKFHGALVSDLVSNNRKNVISFPLGTTKFRRSAQSGSTRIFKEVNYRQKMDKNSSSCNTNILVIESDRCYRVEGANVMLEFSASREWFLVVKKDGLTRYTHKAQEVMRPCSCNRFTHAIIWMCDNDWKLEFRDRGDWLTFKDLYKECSDRNVLLPSDVKIIPVPGVHEVSGYEDSTSPTFLRPDYYIKMNDDEVSRALSKKTAIYELDVEDEEWLKEFNTDYVAKSENHECILAENFELMIDALEKAFYCNPDDLSDEAAALCIFQDLGNKREVVEAVYSYWMKKRKQKRSSLLKVFQGHQPKKTSHVQKPALRKRRSMKRHPSQAGRGKQPIVLQALAAEQEALEERVILKAQETKAAASRSAESAILKRQRAQLKMENADLAAYKALMALRIAEAAQVTEPPEVGAAHLLDWKCGANDANLSYDLSTTVRQSAS